MYLKSLQKSAPFKPILKDIIDIPLLYAIIDLCDKQPLGYIFKTVYLVSFFSFLRISNLCPHSVNDYSPLRQLAKGDVICEGFSTSLLIKSSKTLQNNNVIKLLEHALCITDMHYSVMISSLHLGI